MASLSSSLLSSQRHSTTDDPWQDIVNDFLVSEVLDKQASRRS